MNKERLDLVLVARELSPSRNIAQQLIKNQKIAVNGLIIIKSNFLIKITDKITVLEQQKYVSRGGIKLEWAFDIFKIDVKNLTVLDVGASSGGFSDVCLQRGCQKIYSLDVGTSQLNPLIKNNPKVIELSNTNIKYLSTILIPDVIDLIVCDLCFISSKYLFQNLKQINLSNNVQIVVLIKPQFEIANKISKLNNYHLTKNKDYQQAINLVKNYANENGFKMINLIESPIKGAKMNNTEFLGYFVIKL